MSDPQTSKLNKAEPQNHFISPSSYDLEDDYQYSGQPNDITSALSSNAGSMKPDQVISLQRLIGNQATMNFISRKTNPSAKNTALPFAGMKMVTPNMIQRAPNDNDSGDADAEEQAPASDPSTAVELDASDNEVSEQNAEIDETISEAQQVQGSIPSDTSASSKLVDGMLPFATYGDENAKPSSGVAASVDLDDDDDVETFEREDSLDDDDGMTPANAVDPTLAAMNNTNNGVPPTGNQIIKGQARHKQKTGVSIRNHHLAAEDGWSSTFQGVATVGRGASTTVDAKDAHDAIKSAVSLNNSLSTIDAASDAGSEGVQGGLEKAGTFFDMPPMNIILPVVMLISRIHLAIVKYKQMKAFKAMAKSGGNNVKEAKKRSTPLQGPDMVGAYGFAKTKRGFWVRVIKAAITVGQILSRLVTILSGGTAALISEAVNASLSLSQGVIKIGQSLKGIYKMIIGKRGKRRLESANTIVDLALDGNEAMLQFLVDGEVFGKGYWFSRDQALKNEAEDPNIPEERYDTLKKLATKPKNITEMKDYLTLAEKEDLLARIKAQVVTSLKSN